MYFEVTHNIFSLKCLERVYYGGDSDTFECFMPQNLKLFSETTNQRFISDSHSPFLNEYGLYTTLKEIFDIFNAKFDKQH